MIQVHPGQVWHEVDPRHLMGRFVKILSVGESHARIVRVDVASHIRAHGARETDALLSRFNGKRGGYEFVASDGEP